MPVAEYRAFHFGLDARHPARQVRTLREFVAELEGASASELEPYVSRGDFSQWIADVVGDYALAAKLRTLEQRHQTAARADTMLEMVAAIRARYDFGPDDHLPLLRPVSWAEGIEVGGRAERGEATRVSE